MKFNDAVWRRLSSLRMQALQDNDVFKAAHRKRTAARHRDPEFQKQRGNLTDEERALVIAEIKSGKKHRDIARDWLLSEGRINHIATEERRGTNSKGKPRNSSIRRDGLGGESR